MGFLPVGEQGAAVLLPPTVAEPDRAYAKMGGASDGLERIRTAVFVSHPRAMRSLDDHTERSPHGQSCQERCIPGPGYRYLGLEKRPQAPHGIRGHLPGALPLCPDLSRQRVVPREFLHGL